ncbi:MAG: PilT/PilU family type 4a pilus ATPase [Lachnospiraceae bacterium]|nr:PilT/PilU family type 4a pilus ATPase [Lachnospiraceae bacterium]
MQEVLNYLKQVVADEASDLFIVAGGKVHEKVEKHIVPISDNVLSSADAHQLVEKLYSLSGRPLDVLNDTGDDDFAMSISGLARFRVNAYKQRGSLAATIRVVSFDIPNWQEMNIPEQVIELSQVTSGLILFTGTSGSGKSTTQACIIDEINKTRDCHIITLEDPIEFLHKNKKSLISQREIAIDTKDYLTALKSCMRQSPDVILLGEMRDHETIKTAMTASETGHLVIATLHTKGAVNTVDRILDSFPSSQQGQIRMQLSMVLHTVVSQQLLPDKDDNLVPAYEVMRVNNAIRNLIRDNKNHQIENVMSSDKTMMTMEDSLIKLFRDGKITKETALMYTEYPEQLGRRLI